MDITRRSFLKSTTASGALLTLGFTIPDKAQAAQSTATGNQVFTANAYIRIAEDNRITLMINKSEMGQGAFTALPMLLAEELDADWEAIHIEPVQLPNSDFRFLGTAGSSSVTSGFMALRQAGASVRAMLIQAAANHWQTDGAKLATKDSHVINPANDKRIPFGALVASAVKLPVPKNPPLKPSEQFRLLGKDIKRTEAPEKVTGRARFGIDTQLPDMRYAVVARPPVFGAILKSVDDTAALKVPGVVKVKKIPAGVAVIADSFWQAKKGRDALNIHWDDGAWGKTSTKQLQQDYRQQADKAGSRPKVVGDPDAARALAASTREMTYEAPYLAHAPMEPLNCTVHDKGDSAEIWTGCQLPSSDQMNTAKILGYPAEKVALHNALLGGGFGRRGASDFVQEAAHTAKGEAWPVKVIWTREDDIQGGYYRPMVAHKARIALAADGKLLAWENTSVGGGIRSTPYDIANLRFDSHHMQAPVPTHWWRSVDNSHTAFAIECMIDEAAEMAKTDPFAYRRALLQKQPRMLALLDRLEKMSGWGGKRPANTGLGVAIHASFGSIVAEVAEVQVENGQVQVNKVWCAVDCGFAVNPLNVRAQMESAIIYGLSAALFGEITFADGKVEQTNFHNYPVVRMHQSPDIEVAIINSGERIGGIGEPGLPPIAPAVANAVFAVTGKRLRALPLKL